MLSRIAVVVATCAIYACTLPEFALGDPIVGVYFDEAGTQQSIEIMDVPPQSGLSEDYRSIWTYVVVRGIEAGFRAFELGLEYPGDALIAGTWLLGAALDGCGLGYSITDLHCAIGYCDEGDGGARLVAAVLFVVPVDAVDLRFAVVDPANEGYIKGPLSIVDCSSLTIPLTGAPSPFGAGVAVASPRDAVPGVKTSWSRIKALY